MLPDWVSNPGPLTYESDALPIALRGPAESNGNARPKILVSAIYSIQLKKHLFLGQFNFSSIFLCFSLVTINRLTSHDYSSRLWNNTRFAN